ncbi:MAG TPA: isoamylase early set domain-containing protein [Gemmatimonadaceae bacterium]|nr:isoamylase early set domain-containing protein [Gemmatimonadaceae bacterium]
MRDLDTLPPELVRAAQVLKASREPGAEWRDRVVREAMATPVLQPRTRWALPVAAAVVGALLGGSAVYAVMHRDAATAAATAAAPRVAGLARSAVNASSRDVPVRFTLRAPDAVTVTIVGDFNGWQRDALPLRRSRDGTTWTVDVPLRPGRYTYAFLVDGVLSRDPAAPQVRDTDFGAANSVVMVK